MPELRTSTMTHLVWCPPAVAREGPGDARRPARAPPGADDLPDPRAGRRGGDRRAGRAEGLRGAGPLAGGALGGDRDPPARDAGATSGSIVLPLLVSDLPVFCRWRGEPAWGSPSWTRSLGVTDRLVVDSSEWRGVPAAYPALAELFERGRRLGHRVLAHASVAPAARGALAGDRRRSRSSASRGRGPTRRSWPGWLRSRLRREIALTRREAATVDGVWVDGEPVESPGDLLNASELLSAELDQFGRDRSTRPRSAPSPEYRHAEQELRGGSEARPPRAERRHAPAPPPAASPGSRHRRRTVRSTRRRCGGGSRCHGCLSTSRTTITGRRRAAPAPPRRARPARSP